jgi:hypothetical protein
MVSKEAAQHEIIRVKAIDTEKLDKSLNHVDFAANNEAS